MSDQNEPRVTGIGGIFFKTKNPEKTREWYADHLGFNVDKWGTTFEWFEGADGSKKAHTQWSPFDQNTDYFDPSAKEFMVNYRVVNLEGLLEKLRSQGVTILDDVQTYDYGKFVHILDVDGNKIELWEPIDTEYEKILDVTTK